MPASVTLVSPKGGQPPLGPSSEDGDSKTLIEAFAASGRPIRVVCHASAVFKHRKGADGNPLVAGRKVTGLTNNGKKAHRSDRCGAFPG